jgi:hypothetical protein
MKKIKMTFTVKALSVLVGAFMMIEMTSCSIVRCKVYDTKVVNTETDVKINSCMECTANKKALKDSLANYKYRIIK